MPGDKFPARRQNKPRSPIDKTSSSLPTLPVSSPLVLTDFHPVLLGNRSRQYQPSKRIPDSSGNSPSRCSWNRDLRLLRRRGAAARRREDRQRSGPGVDVEVTREPVGVVGADHAVELSDRDSGLEDRAGACLRQLRRVQAGRSRAGLGACARRDHRALRPAGGRVQPRDGPRLGSRRDAARHPDVAAISFTGSVATGRKVAQAARRRRR